MNEAGSLPLSLLAAPRLPEDKLLEALNELLESLQLVEAAGIPVGVWMQARRLCVSDHPSAY